jgi:hydrogenase maturation protease
VVDASSRRARRRIVIGIGNPDRGDDGVGRQVARLLVGRVPDDVEVVELDGEATALLEQLETAETAYLIDAAASGSDAGTVQRFDCREGPLPEASFRVSTHGLGLGSAIELARALGQLPPRCVVYAIEVADVAAGAGITGEIRASARALAARILEELRGEDPA